MPGAPSSAATANPESSASAGRRAAVAAACALSAALAANVSPVSSGSGRPSSAADTTSTPNGCTSSRISRTLPGLWLAITSRAPRSSRRASAFTGGLSSADRLALQRDQLLDAESRQTQQLEKLRLGERHGFGGALDLDDAAGAREHEIGVGIG